MSRSWILLAALVATPAYALQLKLTPAEQCALSDSVVVAEVVDVETTVSSTVEGGFERHAYVSVGKTLRGPALDGLTVRLPGGTDGVYTHWVEDVPALEVDQRYVLFLENSGGMFEVVGGEAGAVLVANPGSLSKGASLNSVLKVLEGCDAR